MIDPTPVTPAAPSRWKMHPKVQVATAASVVGFAITWILTATGHTLTPEQAAGMTGTISTVLAYLVPSWVQT
jgi:hypothetical protein